MNADRHGYPEIALPESLAGRIREFRQRLWFVETATALFAGLCGLLLTYAALLAADRLWDTPAPVRALLTIAGGGAAVWAWLRWGRNWVWGRRNARALARLLQRRYRGLGDSLLGAVELAENRAVSRHMSPALCRAALRQVAESSARYDFKKAAETKWARVAAAGFAVVAAAVATPAVLFPEAAWNTLLRWTRPLSPVPRYTFVQVERIPPNMVVPHGEEFDLACALSPLSRWKPAEASCRFENQPPLKRRVEREAVVFRVPGQTEAGRLSLRLGDFIGRIEIVPAFRPELRNLTLEADLPAYLERPPRRVPVEGGRTELLEGSQVRFVGTASRALRSAEMRDGQTRRLDVSGRCFFSPKEPAGAVSNACSFTWVDVHGLAPAEPYALNIAVAADEPPVVECRGIERAVAILADETVRLEASASDDYGIRDLRINWFCAGAAGDAGAGPEGSVPLPAGTRVLREGGPTVRDVSGAFVFSPAACRVPEDSVVTLCAQAADYVPGRRPSSSAVFRVYVLSRPKHAQLLQEHMERIHRKLEEVAREEERLLDRNREIRSRPADALAGDRTAADLRESEAGENRNAAEMSGLARLAEEVLKEALRNREMAPEVIRRWTELARKMGSLGEQDMRDVAGLLARGSADSGRRGESVAGAVSKQEEIVKALLETERRMNKSLEDVLARSLQNRLLLAASSEQGIGAALRSMLPEVIGAATEDLPPEKRNTIRTLASRQQQTKKEAGYILDDLGGYFHRTRIPKYDAVRRDMEEKRAPERLAALADLIRKNVGNAAIAETDAWRVQFERWAEMLADKTGGQPGGAGAGAGEPGEADLEALLLLVRARQKEETLREQTRIAEEGKARNPDYTPDARKLGGAQLEIAGDARDAGRKTWTPQLRSLIEKVEGEMLNAAVYLRRPQTDAETVAIETEIIELLSNCVAAACGSSGGAAAMMESLGIRTGKGRKPGSGTGRSGGGSTAGGTTDAANTATGGGPAGATPDPRSVDKAGGAVGEDLPEEFRDFLEAYFRGLEDRR